MSERAKSVATYAVAYALVIAVAVLARIVPVGPLRGAFAWPFIAGIGVAGAIGVALLRLAGVPEFWDPAVTAAQRWIVPALIGVAFGGLTTLQAFLDPHHGTVTPFPISIPVFAAGGIVIEVMLRLFGTTVIAAVLRAITRRADISFWIAAAVAALYEPLPYLHDVHASAILVAVRLFAFNIAAAWFYRRAGFLSALSVRWSEYLVWHVVVQTIFGLT